MKKVEEQKGKINPNPPTMKSESYDSKARGQREENAMIRRNQLLDLHEPKR